MIALFILVGAVAVREIFPAAIISVMLATDQTVENWADRRARRELSALLARRDVG